MKKFFAFITVFCLQIFYSQSVTKNLDKEVQSLLASSPMYSGNLSFMWQMKAVILFMNFKETKDCPLLLP